MRNEDLSDNADSELFVGTGEATPADMNYRMPAEWRPHQATWLSWPHNVETWPGKFETVEPAMDRVARVLAETELVYVNADSDKALRDLEKRFEGMDRIRVCRIPTNDAWIRDHGATFVSRADEDAPDAERIAAVDWRYNAWGGKYPPWDLDEAVARQMAELLGVLRYPSPLHCEGGAIETDGEGLLMTTASCLLNDNRNPGWSRAEVERHLREMLGVTQILWLPGTELEGDDTDGHIDNLARFTEGQVVLAASAGDDDSNAAVTRQNFEYLREQVSTNGRPLEVRALPLPAPSYYSGRRLPASYANFYVANEIVLLPTYRQRNADEAAAQVLNEHFPGRDIVGIDCMDLIWGLGALHCLTQQVPA